MRYHVSGYFTWEEVVRHMRRVKVDVTVEAENENDAKDRAIEEANIDFCGEVEYEDYDRLATVLLPDPTPEELEQEGRGKNERMMRRLGIPTLFEANE